ncbi:hypothetical protein C1O66_00895 [Paucibacter aquatile]|uniref:Uncharacterized protein n=1 Tax=Kinneretia aquatilis TaxID=2070761 RepID=A0A2N8L2R5_9BURK|nr:MULTISPECIES: hypothetical protein [Roseateles]OYU29501.1 MAG: hypothetical protein CFE41_00965 [Burkholderiales bacterium PBB2]PND39991.1 hypothetical protein C1O66_00895 [Paucibacter aquatile]WIV98827.1 hypothetical protein K9V56_004830 [Paucibacter aquatile]
MRSEVKVVFSPLQQFDLVVDAEEVLSFEAARKWLDEQYVKNECEPMRGSGKVLLADKILGVAAAVGPAAFSDPAWAMDYARATSGALSKALLKVDVAKRTLSY